jgi:hypothetical protein
MQRKLLPQPGAGIVAAMLVISLLAPGYAFDTNGISQFRSLNGAGNSLQFPNSGRADSLLIRVAGAAYGDGFDLPRGVPLEDEGNGDVEPDEQTLPSAREISNLVHDQGTADRPSQRRLNQLFFQFGQFLSHDTGLSEPNGTVATGGNTGLSGNESFNVAVSGSDPDFAFPEISLTRTVSEAASVSPTGVREQINTITAFIDASNVYGSSQIRANALRTFRAGKLKQRTGPDGALLPPNSFGIENANPLHLPETSLFAAGDVRANEQVGLIAFHTLFLREHNRLAEVIADRDFRGVNLENAGVDEEIYQRARAVVGATLQKITYYEWLPALIGFGTLPAYQGYRPNVDPQIANEFSTAAFRLGHTMLPSVYRVQARNGAVTELALQNAFFNPSYVSSSGIDGILRGQAGNYQQEIDRFIVDDVRNFLFGPGFGGLDLAALNIQRGRDHGIPSYHRLRLAYGLPGINSFNEVSPNTATVSALRSAYGSGRARDIDPWTGGISERHLRGTNLGETFTRIFVDQFTRLRDGDRFYFENTAVYSRAFIDQIFQTSLADVIRRNTGLNRSDVNSFAFFRPGYEPFQPDLRIGQRRAFLKQKGNNRYNSSGRRQKLALTATSGRSVRFHTSLQNDGAFQMTTKIRASLRSPHLFLARVFSVGPGGRKNETGALFAGRYRITNYPGDTQSFQSVVRVTARSGVSRSRATVVGFRAEDRFDRSICDVVTARVRM